MALEKYKIKLLGSKEGYNIYLMDGVKVRNLLNLDITVGGSNSIYYWIPEKEIFIDNHIDSDEIPLFVHRFISLEKACQKDENSDQELEKIYKKERLYRKNHTLYDKVEKIPFAKIGSVQIDLVKGRAVRDHLDVEFAMGGNPAAYDFVLPDTIWLDSDFSDEYTTTLFHEMVEFNKILQGQEYFQSHEEANSLGGMLYDSPNKMREVLCNEFKKSYILSKMGLTTTTNHYHSISGKFD